MNSPRKHGRLVYVERVVATRSDVEALSRAFYGLKTSLKTAEQQITSSWLAVDLGNQEFLSSETEELDPAAAPVITAVDHILSYAFEQRASDIHFEPKRNATLVRLRIDGVLHEVHLIPRVVYQAIVSRIKLLSGCNLAEKRRPQDGRIKREQGGREIEIRVSTMPHGVRRERPCSAIFDPDVLLKQVDQLGLSRTSSCRCFSTSCRETNGIILVTRADRQRHDASSSARSKRGAAACIAAKPAIVDAMAFLKFCPSPTRFDGSSPGRPTAPGSSTPAARLACGRCAKRPSRRYSPARRR